MSGGGCEESFVSTASKLLRDERASVYLHHKQALYIMIFQGSFIITGGKIRAEAPVCSPRAVSVAGLEFCGFASTTALKCREKQGLSALYTVS